MIKTRVTFNDETHRMIADMTVRSAGARKGRQIFGLIFGVLGCVMTGMIIHGIMTHNEQMYIVEAAIAGLLFYTAIWGIKRYQYNKALDTAKRATLKMDQADTREYTFDEKEIHVFSSKGESIYKWTAMATFGEHGHYLVITLKNNSLIVVDKNEISAEEAAQIESWLLENNVLREAK